MSANRTVSRRRFVGGLTTTLGSISLASDSALWAQRGVATETAAPTTGSPAANGPTDEYDSFAKLAGNENPWGPPDSVVQAMQGAFKYANRYGYPDGAIVNAIAQHHGVKPESILLGAGSSELLNVVGLTFLQDGKKVVGVDPTYVSVYQHATSLKSAAIRVPLLSDYRQDIPALIQAIRRNHREVGFLFFCNPNNPTGLVVPKQEVRQLLDAIPEDVPVLIDEAYHHFVDDPAYATSVPYVLEGRPVIITRTFSKISGLAGMRLGYAVTTPELVQRMRPLMTGSINAVVKWGGVAALKDSAAQERVKRMTMVQRLKTTKQLLSLGYSAIPSECNFFMLHIRRPVVPVIEEFRSKGVLVGRPFPPMLEHLRVSIGTEEEMRRFMVAFKEIMAV
ncbi:MAG: aminotransferase class I/II-fold pyridoxal phosphate-dependent enzyme [Anaerolineae bacterium]|nr:aminotransferase class I/II-fold pyridoxal phosphate-dependent enzyme [Gemmatimonadaceae bacterium]